MSDCVIFCANASAHKQTVKEMLGKLTTKDTLSFDPTIEVAHLERLSRCELFGSLASKFSARQINSFLVIPYEPEDLLVGLAASVIFGAYFWGLVDRELGLRCSTRNSLPG